MIAVQLLVEAAVLCQQLFDTPFGSPHSGSPLFIAYFTYSLLYSAVRMEAWLNVTEHKQLFAHLKGCSRHLIHCISVCPTIVDTEVTKVSSCPTLLHSSRSTLCLAGTGIDAPSYGHPNCRMPLHSVVDDIESKFKELFVSHPGFPVKIRLSPSMLSSNYSSRCTDLLCGGIKTCWSRWRQGIPPADGPLDWLVLCLLYSQRHAQTATLWLHPLWLPCN